MTLEERVAKLEVQLAAITIDPANGNVTTGGNLSLLDKGRPPSSPVKLLLGYPGLREGLYFFLQNRFPGQALGNWWAGYETAVTPPDGNPPSWGYGGAPGRLWYQQFVAEADGTVACRSLLAERVYLSPPVYRDMRTGEFVRPAAYSSAGEPMDVDGNLLGGIYFTQESLGTYLTLHDGQPVLVHNGEVKPL